MALAAPEAEANRNITARSGQPKAKKRYNLLFINRRKENEKRRS
jgi:hypothetical protein